MKLLIKQRVFAWGDTYDIYDENDQVKYFVKAEMFTWGHQIHVYDAYDNEIGFISQQILTFLPKFDISVRGVMKGTIKKEFSFFEPVYSVEYNNWSCEGDWMGWDYDISDGANVIAHISKELWHWGDTYVIDVLRPEDELDVMMLCIAIDAANCDN